MLKNKGFVLSHVYVAYMCICALCVCSTYRGQKEESDPLKLALEVVIKHHISAGSQTGSSERASIALNHHASSPAPVKTLLKLKFILLGLISVISQT